VPGLFVLGGYWKGRLPCPRAVKQAKGVLRKRIPNSTVHKKLGNQLTGSCSWCRKKSPRSHSPRLRTAEESHERACFLGSTRSFPSGWKRRQCIGLCVLCARARIGRSQRKKERSQQASEHLCYPASLSLFQTCFANTLPGLRCIFFPARTFLYGCRSIRHHHQVAHRSSAHFLSPQGTGSERSTGCLRPPAH